MFLLSKILTTGRKQTLALAAVYTIGSLALTTFLRLGIFSNIYSRSALEGPILAVAGAVLVILYWFNFSKVHVFLFDREKNPLILALAATNFLVWSYQFLRIQTSPFSSLQWLGLILYALAVCGYFSLGRIYFISCYILLIYLWRQDVWLFSSRYESADVALPVCLSSILLLHTLVSLWLKRPNKAGSVYLVRENDYTFATFVCLAIISGYGLAGLFKITSHHETALSVLKDPFAYIFHNQMVNILLYYFHSGMDMLHGFPGVKQVIVDVFTSEMLPLINAGVIVGEACMVFGLLSRRFFAGTLIIAMTVNLILFITGLFFWKWILIDGVIVYFILKKNQRIFHRPRLIFAIFLPIFLVSGAHPSIPLHRIFFVPVLGWSDGTQIRSKIDRSGWFYGKRGASGQLELISGINPNLFYPFAKNMEQVWNHKDAGRDPVLSGELNRFFDWYAPRLCKRNEKSVYFLNHIWNLKSLFADPCQAAREADEIVLVNYILYLDESLLKVKEIEVGSVIYSYSLSASKQVDFFR